MHDGTKPTGLFRPTGAGCRRTADANRATDRTMIDGMSGMMWGMGLLWLLVIVVLVFAAAALVKYLRSDRSR
jgi:tellurite resistance protein TehA-like permease